MNARKFFSHMMIAMVLSLIALFVSANIARADDGFGGPVGVPPRPPPLRPPAPHGGRWASSGPHARVNP